MLTGCMGNSARFWPTADSVDVTFLEIISNTILDMYYKSVDV